MVEAVQPVELNQPTPPSASTKPHVDFKAWQMAWASARDLNPHPTPGLQGPSTTQAPSFPAPDKSGPLANAVASAKDGLGQLIFIKGSGPETPDTAYVIVQNTATGIVTDPNNLLGQGSAPSLGTYLADLHAVNPNVQYSFEARASVDELHAILSLPPAVRPGYIANYNPSLSGVLGYFLPQAVVGPMLGRSNQESDSGEVGDDSLIDNPAQMPVSRDQIAQVQNQAATGWLARASAAPDTSDLKIAFNLYKALWISHNVTELKSSVDTGKLGADLAEYLRRPDVRNARDASLESAAQQVVGDTPRALARSLSEWLLAGFRHEYLTGLRTSDPAAYHSAVNNLIGQVGYLDQDEARQTVRRFVGRTIEPPEPLNTIAEADVSDSTQAVTDMFVVGTAQSHYGLGTLSHCFVALSKLTPDQLANAAKSFALAIKAMADSKPLEAGIPDALEAALRDVTILADPEVAAALSAFTARIFKSGAFGTLSAILATLVVVQGFAGGGSAAKNTPWGRVCTGGDIAIALGKASRGGDAAAPAITAISLAIKPLYLLMRSKVAFTGVAGRLGNVDLNSASAVERAVNEDSIVGAELESGALSRSDVDEFCSAIVALSASRDPTFTGPLAATLQRAVTDAYASPRSRTTLEEKAATIAALDLLSAGLALQPAARGADSRTKLNADALTDDDPLRVLAGDAAAASASEETIAIFQKMLREMGVLGDAANVIYASPQAANMTKALKSANAVTDFLELGSALALGASGIAQIGIALSVFSGPAAPIFAAIAAAAGFAFGIASNLIDKADRQAQLDEFIAFLKSGVGTNNNYYRYPSQDMNGPGTAGVW